MSMDPDKIKALITLLDDPSEEIFNTVEDELLKAEVEIVPELEKVWETQPDGVMQHRIENIIHSLQFRDVKKRLKAWAAFDGENLLAGAWLIAKYQYPELTFEEIDQSINKMCTGFRVTTVIFLRPRTLLFVMFLIPERETLFRYRLFMLK